MSLSLCVGTLRETAWDSRSFFHQPNLCWFLQPEVMGTYLPGIGTMDWGAWHVAWIPCSQDIPPEHLSATRGCGTSLFHISTPPTSLDGCGFFNSVIVRLPFNSIYNGSEWWLFYTLVVILMWLYKELSRVYLCHCLDQKFSLINLKILLYSSLQKKVAGWIWPIGHSLQLVIHHWWKIWKHY